MTKNELGKRIFELSNIKGEFLLRSGVTSNEYFDKYLFESPPDILKAVAESMSKLLPPKTDALAGLELGGVPLATMLSQITGIPALFIRKAAKDYGTCKLAEGGDVKGRRLVIIEDVVTSGGQIIKSVAELRTLGAVISDVLCVIDREAGGQDNLVGEKLRLHALFTMSELKRLGAAA
ncbi:MAG: orotate phosphoribosyltransferase [Deltaproteobacteria bacterium]|nr:orotate phosphoribosyltransferase [Deltaproteobacteria bacterium]